ncbi:Uncharacterised protein [Yersinia aldovae]|nr:Uncharacterised protein [Yersinia aldovae]
MTAPFRVPLLFNVFAPVPVKLMAVAPVALILVLAPMVVMAVPSVISNPVPPLLVTLILRFAPEKSTPPPLAFIPVPAPETFISKAAGFSALRAVLVVAIPVPVPVILMVLRPLALLANVSPASVSSAVLFAVLSVTWLSVKLVAAALEKASPVPPRLIIKSARA